jgi:molybdopterin-guanine dinucleotide biosynthesis protein A
MRSSIILCGGRGQRMGQDKGLVLYKGKLLISHVLDVVIPEFRENILVFRDVDQYKKYYAHLKDYPELKIVYDLEQDQGPLIGIYSGLKKSKSDSALIFPCDSPLIDTKPIRLLKNYPLDGHAALVPQGKDGRLEPLHSVYEKDKTLKAIEIILGTDKRNVKSLYRFMDVKYIPVEEVDPTGKFFVNLNRPSDLEK